MRILAHSQQAAQMRTADLGAPARNGGRDAVLFREAAGASQLLPPYAAPLVMDLFDRALDLLTPEAVEKNLPLDEPHRGWVICTAGPWQLIAYAMTDYNADSTCFETEETIAALKKFDLYAVGVVVTVNAAGVELGRDSIWGVWLDHRDSFATYTYLIELIGELTHTASDEAFRCLRSKIADLKNAADIALHLEPAYATTVNF